MEEKSKYPNHSHAWHGTWDRPMDLDEKSLDAFTVARMTDHNVKGTDVKEAEPGEEKKAVDEAKKDAA